MTKKTDYRAEHPAEYEQGRRSRLTGISREESPYADTKDQDGKVMHSDALKAWEAGYDDAEGEAARNETSAPDDAPKADDQLTTTADANKAKAKG